MAITKLKPVSRITLSDQVAAQIAAQISDELWRPGDKLPAESDLCATMQIGRSTLREALKSLAYVGVVQMRPGEGTYVTGNAHTLAHRIHTRGLLKSDKELQDVSEARLILETELAAMAADRLQPEDLERMEEILREMKRCLDEGGQDYAALDVDFHLAIAKSSKNQLMYELLVQIRHVLQDFIATSQELPGMKDSAHEHHARILAALRQRNPEKARREMRTHLQVCEKAFSLLEKISEATPVSRAKRRA